MRARYYNPYIGRFISSDPSGFSGGLNFYTLTQMEIRLACWIHEWIGQCKCNYWNFKWLDKGLNYAMAQDSAYFDQTLARI